MRVPQKRKLSENLNDTMAKQQASPKKKKRQIRSTNKNWNTPDDNAEENATTLLELSSRQKMHDGAIIPETVQNNETENGARRGDSRRLIDPFPSESIIITRANIEQKEKNNPPGYPVTPGSKKKKDPLVSSSAVDGTLTCSQQSFEVDCNPITEEIIEADTETDLKIEVDATQYRTRPMLTISSWIYYLVRLGVFSILLFVALSVYQSRIDSIFMNDSIHSELSNMQIELEAAQIQKEADMRSLHVIQNDLTQSREEYLRCHHYTGKVKESVKTLEKQNSFLQSKLEIMIGTGDNVQLSLNKAWETVDQLRKDNSDVLISLDRTDAKLLSVIEVKNAIHVEQELCNIRVVELELESIGQETRLEETFLVVKEYKEEMDLLQLKYHDNQDLVSLLQHQLEEENVHSWYYELQIQHIESEQEGLEETVRNLTFENHGLKQEVQRLNRQILTQYDEAVSALNAVARSATHRKVEQLAVSESHVASVKEEAANALNSVLASMFNREESPSPTTTSSDNS